MTTTVTVRCPKCKTERVIQAGEIPAGDIPMCETCYGPMIAVRAETKFD